MLLLSAGCGSSPARRWDRESGQLRGGGERRGGHHRRGRHDRLGRYDRRRRDDRHRRGDGRSRYRRQRGVGRERDGRRDGYRRHGRRAVPVGSAQCSDGIDNDGDGKIDYDDPECVGPLDNDESSFATGIPGDNMDACKQDCFFDGNSGVGDDHCDWQLKCDPTSVEQQVPVRPAVRDVSTRPSARRRRSQSQACINFCRKLVPNGCDCFGCCVVPGAPTPIRLAATCTAADFGNPAKCPPCTQVTQCSNPCEHCEICIGKPTLPADCTPGVDGGTDGPPPPNCGSDFQACGPGTQHPRRWLPAGLRLRDGLLHPGSTCNRVSQALPAATGRSHPPDL